MKKLMLSILWVIMVVPLLTLAQLIPAKVSSNAPWSVRMADSDMIRNPEVSMLDFVKAPKWNYTNGLVCSAHEGALLFLPNMQAFLMNLHCSLMSRFR